MARGPQFQRWMHLSRGIYRHLWAGSGLGIGREIMARRKSRAARRKPWGSVIAGMFLLIMLAIGFVASHLIAIIIILCIPAAYAVGRWQGIRERDMLRE